METDNKYDQSFRNSELGKSSIKEQMDDNSDQVAEAVEARASYFEREPEDFGGGRGWN